MKVERWQKRPPNMEQARRRIERPAFGVWAVWWFIALTVLLVAIVVGMG